MEGMDQAAAWEEVAEGLTKEEACLLGEGIGKMLTNEARAAKEAQTEATGRLLLNRHSYPSRPSQGSLQGKEEGVFL